MINSIDPLAQSQLFTLKGDTVISDATGGSDKPDPKQCCRHHLPDEIIDQKYKIISLLGEGGMGAVYKAQHLFLNKEVALKTFRSANLTEESWIRFQREAQAIALLTHQNIVQAFDFGVGEDNVPYYTMECLSGESLADRLKATGPLPLNEVITIFLPVCLALSIAHRKGIIHRDLKPANIFLATRAAGTSQADTVKIVDFGIAGFVSQAADAQKLTRTGFVFGSPLYMSPEQSSGQRMTAKADIYSCGCALFETLTGSPPFRGENAFATMLQHQQSPIPNLNDVAEGDQFPRRLNELIGKMLAKQEDQRIQSFEEVAAELEQIQKGCHQRPSPILNDSLFEHKSEHVSQHPFDENDGNDGNGWTKSNLPIGRNKILVLSGALCLIVFCAAVFCLRPKPVTKPIETTNPAPAVSGTGQSDSLGMSDLPESTKKPVALKISKPVTPETWASKRFYQGITEQSGKKFKKWIFPQSKSVELGFLLVPDRADPIPMIGELKTPADANVAYKPAAKIIDKPELMKGFTDGDFSSIELSGLTPAQFEKIVAVLPKFQSITFLQIFDISTEHRYEGPDPSFVPNYTNAINQFPNLIYLNTNILSDDKSLGQISRLKMLKNLGLGFQAGNPRNITSLSKPFKNSAQLMRLALYDARVTSQTIKDLCTCPNLESIIIHSKDKQVIAADQITGLDGIWKLHQLELQTVHYSPLLLDTVRKCRSLRKLNFRLDSDLTKDQTMALRQAVPNAAVEISWFGKDEKLQIQYCEPLRRPVR